MASVQKRGNTFRIMISLGYGMDGRQIRKTATYTPPPEVTPGKAEKLAKAFAHDFEKRCRGLTNLGENMRFHELTEWYYREVAPNLVKPISLYNQQLLMKLYVLPEFGHLKLKSITTARLDELFNHLKRDGGHRAYYALSDPGSIPNGTKRETAKLAGLTENIVYRACSGGRVTEKCATKIAEALGKKFKDMFTLVYEHGGLSASTVSRVRGAISAVFTTAVRKGMMEKNPAANTTPPKGENQKKLFLDEIQCKQLLSILDDHPNAQFGTMITTLLYTGLRSGELLALRWEDIDLDGGFISVRHTLTLLHGEYSLSTPKTRSSKRTVKLPEEVIARLREHRHWQATKRLQMGVAWDFCGQVFTNEKGWFYNRTTLNQQFKRLLKKNDLPDLHIHDLRHANASLLINAGIPAKVVAEHLGHQSVQTTENVYAHAFTTSREKATDVIASVLSR